jgi:hypothetical protein
LLLIALLGMLGTFLPWMTLLGVSAAKGTDGDGSITLGLYVPAVLMAVVGDWKKSWQGSRFTLFTISALLASAVGTYDLVNFYRKRASGSLESEVLKLAHVGWGLYLVAAAGITLVVVAFVLQGPAQRRRVESRRAAPAEA